MPDLETRLPELLRRSADASRPDPRLERRVLRRARRRRVATASVATLATAALVAGLGLGARELLRAERVTPGGEAPNASQGTVAYLPNAVWPEVTVTGLEDAQAMADLGEIAWRLDPVRTAVTFATDVLVWDPADVVTRWLPGPDAAVRVVVSNRGLGPGAASAGPPAPDTVVRLEQLGRTGEGGIWSVVGADSDRIRLDPPPETVESGSVLTVGIGIGEAQVEWSPTIELLVGDPLTEGPGGRHGRYLVAGEPVGELPGEAMVRVPPFVVGTVGVVVRLVDPEGTTVAADIVPITVEAPAPGTGATGGATGPSPTGSGGSAEELPSAVLATRDAIAIAAEAHDFDALEALIDADRFAYNFDDGSNPVPEWRTDPAVLDTLVTILQMPFTTNEQAYPDVAEGSSVVYIWPSLVASDLADLTAEERALLEELEITEREVQEMLDAFGAYVGPRTGIAEDGTWVYYTIGGD